MVLDPDCGFYHETEAPIVLDDTTNKFEKGRTENSGVYIGGFAVYSGRFYCETGSFIWKGFRYKIDT